MQEFTEALKSHAQALGFVLSGVAAAAEPARLRQLHEWLDAGYAGQMQYLEARRAAYASPSHILDGCKTLVMLAYPYPRDSSPEIVAGTGRVARYARGEPDYHDHLFERLQQLKRFVLGAFPTARVRGVVDTAPLLEREMAQAAGLGWVGKNTLLLNRRYGSYFFLAALLTDLPLCLDQPSDHSYCGTCTACLSACPTQAFPRPYVLDARRCISYLTIEHRGDIPDELAERMGDWVFGCDICQEVCPWNRRAAVTEQSIPTPVDWLNPAQLLDMLQWDDETFRRWARHTPLWRSKRRGVLRNACLVIGNQRYAPARAALEALQSDSEPLLRHAASWALERLNQHGRSD